MSDTDSRPIDQHVTAMQRTMQSRFAYVSKARANVWLTTMITLGVLGLFAGIGLVAYNNASTPNFAAVEHGAFMTVGPAVQGPTAITVAQTTGYVFDAGGSGGASIRYMIDWGDGSAAADLTSGNGSVATAQHAYSHTGLYVITARAAFATSDQFSVPSTLSVAVSQAIIPATAQLVSVSLDQSSSTEPAAVFSFKAGSTDVTLQSLTIVGKGDSLNDLGVITVVAGDTALGSGMFSASSAAAGSASVVIPLGAGITIPAGQTTQLNIMADVVIAPTGGSVALGVGDVTSKPATLTPGNLPLYAKTITISKAR